MTFLSSPRRTLTESVQKLIEDNPNFIPKGRIMVVRSHTEWYTTANGNGRDETRGRIVPEYVTVVVGQKASNGLYIVEYYVPYTHEPSRQSRLCRVYKQRTKITLEVLLRNLSHKQTKVPKKLINALPEDKLREGVPKRRKRRKTTQAASCSPSSSSSSSSSAASPSGMDVGASGTSSVSMSTAEPEHDSNDDDDAELDESDIATDMSTAATGEDDNHEDDDDSAEEDHGDFTTQPGTLQERNPRQRIPTEVYGGWRDEYQTEMAAGMSIFIWKYGLGTFIARLVTCTNDRIHNSTTTFHGFKHVSIDEMRTYIGLMLAFSLVQLQNYKHHWTSRCDFGEGMLSFNAGD